VAGIPDVRHWRHSLACRDISALGNGLDVNARNKRKDMGIAKLFVNL
jgi:hypothetical protein